MKVNEPGDVGDPPRRRTQAERNAATRTALLAAARALFGARAFTDVSTQEIVDAAGVTRGALYHQFGGKTELYDALVVALEQETIAALAAAMADAAPDDPVETIRVGVRAWLDLSGDPRVHRILLIDAPGVIGWDRWRAIGEQYGLGMIEALLTHAIEAGVMGSQPVKATAHVLLGALDEAVLYIARAPDRAVATAEMYEVTDRLIAAFTAT